jgi:hypothetical protein
MLQSFIYLENPKTQKILLVVGSIEEFLMGVQAPNQVVFKID